MRASSNEPPVKHFAYYNQGNVIRKTKIGLRKLFELKPVIQLEKVPLKARAIVQEAYQVPQ
jgi:hypothetical protein